MVAVATLSSSKYIVTGPIILHAKYISDFFSRVSFDVWHTANGVTIVV